ncbi:UNVERIFIED_CONTAM: pheromone processing endoprotease [Siphonaria sp. JEL0065]|nr:pheromone processing endoprotease [Siphonaria sp. JEL0065]
MQDNHIYSCSWGPTDDGRTLEAPSTLVAEAFVNGITNGRGGLGSIFVFASGNGGLSQDNCNFDGFTNSIYTITVSSVDRYDGHPGYSESCSANMVVMYSSADVRHDDAIATTDWYLGVTGDVCTRSHGGTSAAAPLASGMYALVNSIRPDLNWRDYQHLSVRTAVPVSSNHSTWFKNGAGRLYSHAFGYGKLDAYQLLTLAKTWKSVPKQVSIQTLPVSPTKDGGKIPQGPNSDVRVSFPVTQDIIERSNFGALEHVTVTVNIDHTYRGDVNVDLLSPSGSKSQLAVKRAYDGDATGFQNWTFMSVVHWDEVVLGTWQVIVSDHDHPDKEGVFKDARITFWGSWKEFHVASPTVAVPPVETGDPVAVVDSGNKTGSVPIVGWVVGSVALIGGIAALIWCLLKRKQKGKRVIVEVDGRMFKPLHDADDYDGDFEMEQ